MQLEVLYFAAVRDLVDKDTEIVVLPGAPTVSDLARWLERRYPSLQGRLHQVRFAVNEAFAKDDEPLREGDVVALIPPVAGGSPARGDAASAEALEPVALCTAPLSVDACLRLVQHPGAGAVALFLGAVRDHHEGRVVTGLSYRAYESMARSEMLRIVEAIEAEWPGVRLAVHHRVGDLTVGDLAVVCAASAPHRAEAFAAGRALIDRIKESVPIWKQERGPGGRVWVGWEDAGCAHDR